MKDKRKPRISLARKYNDYFEDGHDKIELVRCSMGGINCANHRAVINKKILASRKFLLNKDYQRSIEALKEAYYTTSDLQETTCINCARLYRCMVVETLENIHDDLKRMTSGWLFPKRYRSSYELASLVLEEFKKEL
jgi:hypothetical protein